MTEIRYRTWFKGTPPRPIRLQVPGWSGGPGYSDGCEPQPWHCKPFVDASTYGFELVYPFANPAAVAAAADGGLSFDGDFTEEERRCGVGMPPFMSFAPHHYGFTSSLDLKTPPDTVTRIEPHPRFYTDHTGTAPVPVPGHIESEWWSRIFFVVFKAPAPGTSHVFRPGEPYAQLVFLPKSPEYTIAPMTPEESARRAAREDSIAKHAPRICSRSYKDHKSHTFDNKYKTLSRAFERGGDGAVEDHLIKTCLTPRPKRIAGCPIRKPPPAG